jgi:hypothetical protein
MSSKSTTASNNSLIHHRADEAASDATGEGLLNAALVFIPMAGLVALGMRNPNFVKRTNWQSRTAIAISKF